MKEYFLDADKARRDCRYKGTKRYLDEEQSLEFQEMPKELRIPRNKDDVYHIVSISEEGRLDLISYQYYGVAFYWWVLAQANNIQDPIEETKVGKRLRIPPMSVVLQLKY